MAGQAWQAVRAVLGKEGRVQVALGALPPAHTLPGWQASPAANVDPSGQYHPGALVHPRQEEEAFTAAYVPELHGVQAALPPEAEVPGGQGTGASAAPPHECPPGHATPLLVHRSGQ